MENQGVFYKPKDDRKLKNHTRDNLVKMSKDEGSGVDTSGTWSFLLPPEYWLKKFKIKGEVFVGRQRAYLVKSMEPETHELEILKSINLGTGNVDFEKMTVTSKDLKITRTFNPPYPKGIREWLLTWLRLETGRLSKYNDLLAQATKDGVIKQR